MAEQQQQQQQQQFESSNFNPVDHVIFDLDGTLINSEKYLYLSINDILSEYDKSFDWDIRSKTLGLHMIKSAPIIIDHFGLPVKPSDYIEKVLKRFKSYVCGEIDGHGVQLLPGVKRLVEHLHSNQIPMAICTGCMHDTFRYKTQPFGDFFKQGKYFSHFVIAGSDPDVGPDQNKPNPKPYLVCIERFGDPNIKSPSQVLAFEDSPTGLQSAVSAGCQTVLIPDPKTKLECLPAKPTIILKSMEEFQPEMFGLPPFPLK